MFKTITSAALLLATTLVAPAASAWNAPIEEGNRTWFAGTLDWAADIHPDSPSTAWLSENAAPPPRELWCVEGSGVTDEPGECDLFDDELEDWLHDFLEVPLQQELPTIPGIPAECASACAPHPGWPRI